LRRHEQYGHDEQPDVHDGGNAKQYAGHGRHGLEHDVQQHE
jgi:hypothetical protein